LIFVFSDCELDWLSHLAHDWESPVWRHWLAELSRRFRLVPLDSSNHLLPERDPAWKHFLAEIDGFLPGLH